MSVEDYKVSIVERRNISGGQKLKLHLVEEESGEVVVEQWKGVSDRQVKNGLKDKLRHWGKNTAEDYESDNPDVTGEEVSL